jgi:hypothetical protein
VPPPPIQIGALSAVERLSLHSNGMSSVPPEIGGMISLTWL